MKEGLSAGQVGQPPAPKGLDFQYTIDVVGRLSTPEEFAAMVAAGNAFAEMIQEEGVLIYEREAPK